MEVPSSRRAIYREGVETDLGTLGGTTSEAFGIDHKGDAVGSAEIAGDAATHAFIYRRGQMTDLNDLIPETSGWVLMSARAINKFSEIVGMVRSTGTRTRSC
jgi:probable HAF family extracellular repeat protein